MRKVACYECGKHYNYDEDGFCPKCGAFNQPPRTTRIGVNGEVVRVDGLREQGHEGSFVHHEFHQEERERKRSGLDREVRRGGGKKAKRPTLSRTAGKKRPLILVLKILGVLSLLEILVNIFWLVL